MKALITIFASFVFASSIAQNPDLQTLLDDAISERFKGINLSVFSEGKLQNYSAGKAKPEDQFFLASTTKLYTASILFKLEDKGLIALNDKISKYLSPEVMKNLHVFKEQDYSDEITINHLLSNTSGLPDYLEEKDQNGEILLNTLLAGDDRTWTCEEAVEISKKMKPHFRPGKEGKAHYSDTNCQILELIINNVSKKSYSQNLQEFIFKPLNLHNTYLYSDPSDRRPQHIYNKETPLNIPKAMTAFRADGGMVSTSEELMIFTMAFFEGKLFDKARIPKIQQWNKVFFPLEYGIGIAKFQFGKKYILIGHPGLSGTFAYYIPSKNAYITGTTNQLNSPQKTYQLLLKIVDKI